MKEKINNVRAGIVANWMTTIIGVLILVVSLFLAIKTGDLGDEFVIRITFALGLIMSSDGVTSTTQNKKEEQI